MMIVTPIAQIPARSEKTLARQTHGAAVSNAAQQAMPQLLLRAKENLIVEFRFAFLCGNPVQIF